MTYNGVTTKYDADFRIIVSHPPSQIDPHNKTGNVCNLCS